MKANISPYTPRRSRALSEATSTRSQRRDAARIVPIISCAAASFRIRIANQARRRPLKAGSSFLVLAPLFLRELMLPHERNSDDQPTYLCPAPWRGNHHRSRDLYGADGGRAS